MHELIARLRRRTDQEAGFTLPELLITLVILGIIATGLAGTVISYLRTTTDTQARISESHDIQFASAYWKRDVGSIGVRSSTYDQSTHSFALQQSVGVTPTCTLPTGSVVGTLAWSDYTSLDSEAMPRTVTVSYITSATAGTYQLFRVRCTGSTVDSTVRLANDLKVAPTMSCARPDGGTSCTGAGDQVPVVVTLSLTAHDPDSRYATDYAATLTGERSQT